MKSSTLIFAAFAVTICFLPSCSSLKCYLCAAVIDSGDACEELNTDYMVINEFAGDNAACVKFESETNGKTVLARNAANKGFCKLSDNEKTLKNCKECTEDLCNSSSPVAASGILLLAATVLIFKHY